MTVYRASIVVFDVLYFLVNLAGLILLGFLALCALAIDPKFSKKFFGS